MTKDYNDVNIQYVKPSMTNLKGRTGQSIIETLKAAKPSDHAELHKMSQLFEKTYAESVLGKK